MVRFGEGVETDDVDVSSDAKGTKGVWTTGGESVNEVG